MATTIAHASATGGQGGSSNLQIFKAHHPPTFKRVGDLVVADHWFRQIRKILEAMCHAPIPGPTRLADPNQFPGRETKY